MRNYSKKLKIEAQLSKKILISYIINKKNNKLNIKYKKKI